MTPITIHDLLTPAQIEQAHDALADTIISLDSEENVAITRIHHLYAERRRSARREAILKALQSEDVSVEMCVEVEAIPAVDAAPVVDDVQADVQESVDPLMEELIEETITEIQEYGVGEIPSPTPKIVEESPKLSQCYTTVELAAALCIHRTSVTNLKQAGLLPEALPGTGTSPQNPPLYEIPDIDALRAIVEKRRDNGRKTLGQSRAAINQARKTTPTPKIDIAPPQIALPDLITQGKWNHPKGFFVGYHKGEDRLDVFGMPLPSGLPFGWVVASVVEPMVGGDGWTCHIPTTIGALRPKAEAIKDLVMGKRKVDAE